jgi:hypothetical protein
VTSTNTPAPEAEVSMAVTAVRGVVVLRFGRDVGTLAMNAAAARRLSQLLVEHAARAEAGAVQGDAAPSAVEPDPEVKEAAAGSQPAAACSRQKTPRR